MKQIRISAITLLLMIITYSANAQIKVVGDDYSSSLTGGKSYYEQDIDFEKVFPKAELGKQLEKIEPTLDYSYNHLGDTLWNYSDVYRCERSVNLSAKIEHCGFGVASGISGEKVIFNRPIGYYVVSGYIIGRENVADLLAKYFSSEDTSKILHYYREWKWLDSIEYLHSIGVGNTTTIKKIKERILRSDNYLYKEDIGFVKLSSVSTINGENIDYYCRLGSLFNVRFYNEIQRQFLNQEIIISGGNYIHIKQNDPTIYGKDREHKYSWGEGKIVTDAITGEAIKLHDDVFIVKDVVVKLENESLGSGDSIQVPHLYVIIEGASTGSFAMHISAIEYNYEICYCKEDGRWVFGDRYSNYEIPRLDFGNNSMYFSDEPTIIRKSDLDKIKKYIIDTASLILNKEKKDAHLREQQNIARHKKEEQEKLQKEEELRQRMISMYGEETASLICKRRIAIGMSQDMCRHAWGRPMNTYRTTTQYGQSEVWCYNYKTKVNFYNGKVVQIDD